MPVDALKISEKVYSLPSSLLFKMQSRWNRIHLSLDRMRKEAVNEISVKQFEEISRYAGVFWTGFERIKVKNIFPQNEGLLEIKPLQSALQTLLQACRYPPADTIATSLSMGPHFDSHRAEGKSIEIKELNTTWNNLRRQVPDPTGGTCEPFIKTIIEGRYYEQRQEPVRPAWDSPVHTQPGLMLDAPMRQPMVKSLVEGVYYFPKNGGAGDTRFDDRRALPAAARRSPAGSLDILGIRSEH